jgi:hypothetical protein
MFVSVLSVASRGRAGSSESGRIKGGDPNCTRSECSGIGRFPFCAEIGDVCAVLQLETAVSTHQQETAQWQGQIRTLRDTVHALIN